MDSQFEGRTVRSYLVDVPRSQIVLLHGGCFQMGDHTWNREQAEALASQFHANVYVPDFPQSSLEDTQHWLAHYISHLPSDLDLTVMGTSSGGYHALWLASQNLVNQCWALCPVADPYARYQYLETSTHPKRNEMMSQQLKYFGSLENMHTATDLLITQTISVPTTLICVGDDQNVPLAQINYVCQHQPIINQVVLNEGGHQTCFQASKTVIDILAPTLQR